MEVVRGFQKRADAAFVVGEVYRLEPVEDRSAASHRHYFAAVAEAWANLPEDQAARFPTSEHLRKWALIQAGYHNRRELLASSKAEAARLAAFIEPMDEYASVTVRVGAVEVLTARSQSVRAMGKTDFQKSKDAVLEILAATIGVTVDELNRAQAA
jgi:hypothetical protein